MLGETRVDRRHVSLSETKHIVILTRRHSVQVTVLTLELDSPTLPAGRKIVFDLKDTAALLETKKNPIIIKEGVEYK